MPLNCELLPSLARPECEPGAHTVLRPHCPHVCIGSRSSFGLTLDLGLARAVVATGSAFECAARPGPPAAVS
jgi:hypothetical protein